MDEDPILGFNFNPGPWITELEGYRAIVTGGSLKQTRQAVYTRQQEMESIMTPPPAATPIIEEELKIELTILWTAGMDMDALRDKLLNCGAEIKVEMNTTGMR